MIEGYIGRPGTGKTYTLTARVLKRFKKYEVVAANYFIDIPNLHELRGPEDLLDLSAIDGGKVLVVIDEAHLWFPSRLSMKLPPSMLMRLSQTRKAGWDLWWSAQHETRVDRVLKDVTNWMWHCQGWFSWVNPTANAPLLFTAHCYEPEYFRKPKKITAKAYRRFTMKVAGHYDTFQELAVASHVEAVRDHYRPDEAKQARRSRGSS